MRVGLIVIVACLACSKSDRDSEGRVRKYVVEPVKSEETSPTMPSPEPPPPMPSPTPTTSGSAISPTPPTPACANPFDKGAVVTALRAVAYKRCAVPGSGGGYGSVTVPFDPATGAAMSASVSGTFASAESACIARAFKAMHVPPYCPPPKTVGWKIEL